MDMMYVTDNAEMDEAACQAYLKDGQVEILGHVLSGEDLKIIRKFNTNLEGHTYESHSDNNVVILLDVSQHDDMVCNVYVC